MKIILATSNCGKLQELTALLTNFPVELSPLTDATIDETGLTFIENAFLKARYASRLAKLPAIADDSGLVVPILHGAPGIYSARYAGPAATANENNKKLLSALSEIPDEKRQAVFHCALVFMLHPADPTPLVCEGTWHGIIAHAAKGELGFGYDPIFYLPDMKKTAAELPLTIKNKISHRGIALQLLVKKLSEKLHESTVS